MDLDKNRAIIAATWKERGWTDTMINGMLGRASRESSFNTSIRNPNDAGKGKDSVGLFQWNRGRLAGLYNYAKRNGLKWNDPRTQALYTDWEITEGPEKATMTRLKNATNIQEAVDAAMLYTRPRGTIINGKLSARTGLHYKETLSAAKKYAGIPIDPMDAMSDVQGLAQMEKDDGRPTTAGMQEASVETRTQQVINDANRLLSENTDNKGIRTGDIVSSDILSGLLGNTAQAPKAPAAPSISELANLFQPRLQWDDL